MIGLDSTWNTYTSRSPIKILTQVKNDSPAFREEIATANNLRRTAQKLSAKYGYAHKPLPFKIQNTTKLEELIGSIPDFQMLKHLAMDKMNHSIITNFVLRMTELSQGLEDTVPKEELNHQQKVLSFHLDNSNFQMTVSIKYPSGIDFTPEDEKEYTINLKHDNREELQIIIFNRIDRKATNHPDQNFSFFDSDTIPGIDAYIRLKPGNFRIKCEIPFENEHYFFSSDSEGQVYLEEFEESKAA